MNQKDIIDALNVISNDVTMLRAMVINGTANINESLAKVRTIEESCTLLKAAIIRDSRKSGVGVKKDGSPDRRFMKNRDTVKTDLRFSRAE